MKIYIIFSLIYFALSLFFLSKLDEQIVLLKQIATQTAPEYYCDEIVE